MNQIPSQILSSHSQLATRRQVLPWLAAVAVPHSVLVGSAFAQARPAPKAIDVSLRQQISYATRLSISSDRIVRNHVQKTLQINTPRPDKGLADARAEVTRLIGELQTARGGNALSAQLPGAAKAYGDFMRNSEQLAAADRPGLIKLADEADKVGEAVDSLVLALVKESGVATADALSASADLQRLTQHLAVHSLMASAGIDAAEQLKEVTKSRPEFSSLLAKLKQSPFKPNQVDFMLDQISNQWLLMDMSLQSKAGSPRDLENVCTTSERLLETLTGLYSKYESAL